MENLPYIPASSQFDPVDYVLALIQHEVKKRKLDQFIADVSVLPAVPIFAYRGSFAGMPVRVIELVMGEVSVQMARHEQMADSQPYNLFRTVHLKDKQLLLTSDGKMTVHYCSDSEKCRVSRREIICSGFCEDHWCLDSATTCVFATDSNTSTKPVFLFPDFDNTAGEYPTSLTIRSVLEEFAIALRQKVLNPLAENQQVAQALDKGCEKERPIVQGNCQLSFLERQDEITDWIATYDDGSKHNLKNGDRLTIYGAVDSILFNAVIDYTKDPNRGYSYTTSGWGADYETYAVDQDVQRGFAFENWKELFSDRRATLLEPKYAVTYEITADGYKQAIEGCNQAFSRRQFRSAQEFVDQARLALRAYIDSVGLKDRFALDSLVNKVTLISIYENGHHIATIPRLVIYAYDQEAADQAPDNLPGVQKSTKKRTIREYAQITDPERSDLSGLMLRNDGSMCVII